MFWFFICTLFIWRLTHMLQEEQGPADIVAKFRNVIVDKDGDIWANPDSKWAQGFLCFYCLSVWVALVPAIFLANNFAEFLAYILALSAGAIFVDKLHKKVSDE